jgi:hypothetical protein
LTSTEKSQKQTGCQKNKKCIVIGGVLFTLICTAIVVLATHNWKSKPDDGGDTFKLSAACLNADNAEYMIDHLSEKSSWFEDVQTNGKYWFVAVGYSNNSKSIEAYSADKK